MTSPLRTRRMHLTPFTLADAPDLFAIRGDRHAMRFWDWPGDTTPAQTHAHALAMLSDMAKDTAISYTARLTKGSFVGLFDLSDLDQPLPDLGFMVVRQLWGQGLATEAARALVAEAWRRNKQGLKARIHSDNQASRRLLLKLGFLRHGPDAPVEVAPGRSIMCEHFRLEHLKPVRQAAPEAAVPRHRENGAT